MKNSIKHYVLALCLLAFNAVASATEKGTAEEAVAMVKKGIALMKEQGKEKAYAEFNNPNGQFVKGDLYVVVFDMQGNNKAHGANPRLIGKNLIELKDTDGVFMVKNLISMAQTKGKGWVDYKWQNSLTKAVEPKSTYVEKFDDVLVGVGIYK